MNTKVVLAFFLLVCGLVMLASNITAEEPAASATEFPSTGVFEEKIIFLTVEKSSALTSENNTVVISEARIEKIGDRYFIVGIGHGGKSGAWYSDMPVGIAWNNVTRFAAMTSEQFEKMSDYWSNRSEGDKQ